MPRGERSRGRAEDSVVLEVSIVPAGSAQALAVVLLARTGLAVTAKVQADGRGVRRQTLAELLGTMAGPADHVRIILCVELSHGRAEDSAALAGA